MNAVCAHGVRSCVHDITPVFSGMTTATSEMRGRAENCRTGVDLVGGGVGGWCSSPDGTPRVKGEVGTSRGRGVSPMEGSNGEGGMRQGRGGKPLVVCGGKAQPADEVFEVTPGAAGVQNRINFLVNIG